MALHSSTFEYLKPTDDQMGLMTGARAAVQRCAMELETLLPEGPDKSYTIRKLREVGMWANVAITREANGAPRE